MKNLTFFIKILIILKGFLRGKKNITKNMFFSLILVIFSDILGCIIKLFSQKHDFFAKKHDFFVKISYFS